MARPSSPAPILRHAAAKPALLAAHLALGWPSIAERVQSLGLSVALGFYIGLFVLLAGGLWLVACLRSDPLRWSLAALLFGSAAFMAANEAITGQHFGYESFINMIGAAGFVGDAVRQHGARIAFALLTALPLLLAIGLRPRKGVGMKRGLLIPIGLLAGFAAILYARGGDGARGQPNAWPPLAYALLLGVEQATAPSTAPREVTWKPGRPAAPGDIVLVIDESVAPTYLDVIDGAGVRSGLAPPPPGIAVHNFGIGAAVTHCSLGSNLTLRRGGTRDDYRIRNVAGPTLWQYAKAAGYRTVYLDAQRTGGAFHNGMDARERSMIDRFVQFGQVDMVERDHALAERLSQSLRDDVPELIVVNKVGAHFPVQAKYPESATRYRPVPGRGGFAGIVDTASREGFEQSHESWRRYRNAYRNTIEWNVGGFFDRLFASGAGNATILYTSDHGQDLNERARPGAATHCSGDPTPAEGAVPILVLAPGGGIDWAAAAARNANRASHYQLFPTMLRLMGYDRAQVAATHGPDLTGTLAGELRFNALFNARLGRQPEWIAVDPARLPRPPADDLEIRR